MIELVDDTLLFRFPEVHHHAELSVSFQRTLRVPDEEATYPLPPGFGAFPLRHVDDHDENLPPEWLRHGGVLLPMYQAEALWIDFTGGYPCAVKVAAGKRNALTGEPWCDALRDNPQDYLVTPQQPWLDGFVVEPGTVRQFVAMPLGAGYSAEEQLTGESTHGGLQIEVCPLAGERYEALFTGHYAPERSRAPDRRDCVAEQSLTMALAPGGRVRQEACRDEHGVGAWQQAARSRCFVHLADSVSWTRITGELPPTRPPTAADYTRAGMPWFDWYAAEQTALDALPALAGLKGIGAMHLARTGRLLSEDGPLEPPHALPLHERRQVREMNVAGPAAGTR